jgi:hypothetical protein
VVTAAVRRRHHPPDPFKAQRSRPHWLHRCLTPPARAPLVVMLIAAGGRAMLVEVPLRR